MDLKCPWKRWRFEAHSKIWVEISPEHEGNRGVPMEEDFSRKGFCFVFAKSQKDSLCWICLVCLRQVFFVAYPFSKHLKQLQVPVEKEFHEFIWPAKIKGHDIFGSRKYHIYHPYYQNKLGCYFRIFSPSTVPGENMKCQFSVSAKNPRAILYPQGGEPTSHKWS